MALEYFKITDSKQVEYFAFDTETKQGLQVAYIDNKPLLINLTAYTSKEAKEIASLSNSEYSLITESEFLSKITDARTILNELIYNLNDLPF